MQLFRLPSPVITISAVPAGESNEFVSLVVGAGGWTFPLLLTAPDARHLSKMLKSACRFDDKPAVTKMLNRRVYDK